MNKLNHASKIIIPIIFLISLSFVVNAQTMVNDCRTLNISGSYQLNQSVSNATTCFTIANDSISLDCAGYTITHDFGGTGGDGIVATGRNNITIENCIIQDKNSGGSNGYGVLFTTTNNSHIINNTIYENSSSFGAAIYLRIDATRNTITNNTLIYDEPSGWDNYGIRLQDDASNNNITNNNITTTGQTACHGIVSRESYNNLFASNRIATSGHGSAAIYFKPPFVSNYSVFRNNILSDPSVWIVVSNSLNNFTNTTFETANGNIRFPGTFNLTGYINITKDKLNITANSAFVNSTNLTALNTSAQITLNGLALSDPKPQVDYQDDGTFIECASCDEVSYSGGTYVFNVSSFTTYRALETGTIDNCDTLTSGTYTLTQSVSSTGTCFTIANDNVSLDCAGYTISFGSSTASSKYGVAATNNNITIKNCIIQDENSSAAEGYAIRLINNSNSFILNNTLTTNGTMSNCGITLEDQSDNNTFENNNISAIGSSYRNHGVYIHTNSNNNTFISNTITTSGTDNNDGILIDASSINKFYSNNISTTGLSSSAIKTINAGNCTFINTMLSNPAKWITSNGIVYNNFTNTTFKTGSGSIRIPGLFTFNNTPNITRAKLNISSNSAFLNSTNLTALNTTAQITLNSITFVDPKPQVDSNDNTTFTDCSSPQCDEVSFAGNIFIFNVSSFTTYRAAEGAVVCGNISSDSTLTADLSATGTCFNITANDITLDCAGYAITGNGSGVGASVYDRTNITITNCNFTNMDDGIRFENTNSSTINNTNSSKNLNRGIYLSNSYSNTIQDLDLNNNTKEGIRFDNSDSNTISTGELGGNNQGGGGTQGGVVLSTSDSNTISGLYMHNNKFNGIYAGSAHHNTIEYNNIDKNCGGNAGIQVSSSHNIIIQNNNITNGTGVGISFDSSANAQILNNNISRNTQQGINFNADNGNHTITGNIIHRNNQQGIRVADDNSTYSNNNITFNLIGIQLNTADNNTISNNLIKNNSDEGIQMTNSHNNTIQSNDILNNSNSGIEFDTSHNNTLTGGEIGGNNKLDVATQGGVRLTSSTGNTIFGSYIYDNNQNGVTLHTNSHRNMIDTNNIDKTASDTDHAGVYVDAGINNITIQNNNITNGTGFGIYFSGGNYPVVSNNRVANNTLDGITLDSTYNYTVSDNTVFNNADYGIYLESTAWGTTSSNTVRTNGLDGIHVTSGFNNTIKNNTVTNNTQGGIEINTEANDTVSSNTVSYNGVGGSQDGLLINGGGNHTIYSNTINKNGNDEGDANIQLTSATADNTVSGNTVTNACEGIYLQNGDNNRIEDNTITGNTNENCPGGATGVHVETASTGNNITNNLITSNGQWGVYALADMIWKLTEPTIVKHNNATFNGSIEFNGGSINLTNATLFFNGTQINTEDANITALSAAEVNITANTSTEYEFQESDTNVTYHTATGQTGTVMVSQGTPGSAAPIGNLLKAVDIAVTTGISNNLNWALIKIFYNATELTNANVVESTLVIYFYNTTAAAWQLEPTQGVDTTNNFVWANVTHFSTFGAFGTAPSTPSSPSSGGGGSSCRSYWTCTEWSECSTAGTQTRTCTDTKQCSRERNRPAEQQNCTYVESGKIQTTEPVAEQEVSGESTETSQEAIEEITETPPAPEKSNKGMIIGIIVVLIAATTAVLGVYIRKKKLEPTV